MLKIFNEYIEGNSKVIEYTKDGETVSHIVRTPIQSEQTEIAEHPSTEEQILFETKYQTLLLETMALGGTN